MKVHFTQSGGFAGLIKQCTLDTETMAADERKQLEALIEQSGLSASSEELSRSARDAEQYEIALDVGTRKISVVRDNTTAAPSVKALVGYLKKCAKPANLK
jgi:hypothetical protein